MKVIGICGSSASGKTTLARELSNVMRCSIINQDNYYKTFRSIPYEQRAKIDFANPNTYDVDLLIKDLKKIREGKDIESPIYSFETCDRLEEKLKIKATDFVVIEGYSLLFYPEIRNLLDYCYFIDASEDVKIKRMIERDAQFRGCTIQQVLDKYNFSVKPNYEKNIKCLKKYADKVLDGEMSIAALVNIVITDLNEVKRGCML